jgi:hypothetical protein
MDLLKLAVKQGEDAHITHGRALSLLKAACGYGRWSKLLVALEIPRATAERQIQFSQAHDCTDPKIRKMLECSGVKFRPTMTAREVQIAKQAVEVAKNAEEEAAKLSHGETTGTEDGDFGGFLEGFQREQQINGLVERKVREFVATQLQPKLLPDQVTQPVGRLELWPSDSISVATVARRIATFVVDELRTCPPGMQNDVWESVVGYVEAEAGIEVKEVKELKVANAGI